MSEQNKTYVMLTDGRANLHLSDCSFDESGSLETAHVVNGAWLLELTETEMLCRTERGGDIRSRGRRLEFTLVEVPELAEREYASAIEWAQKTHGR